MADGITFIIIIISLGSAIFGGYIVYSWMKNSLAQAEALKKASKWETPNDFKERTGSGLPGEAAVYCRWKKDGPMYKKLKKLHESNIATDPDGWTVHTHFTALSLGNAHGEKMEILCANSDLGYPPPPPRHAEV
jgi:hypothetical protein